MGIGGRWGIRTHEGLAALPVFKKSGALGRGLGRRGRTPLGMSENAEDGEMPGKKLKSRTGMLRIGRVANAAAGDGR